MTPIAFLLDVDNTLLDNDSIVRDFKAHVDRSLGTEGSERYWKIVDELWAEEGYADYLGAVERYRIERPRETRVFEIAPFLLEYDFPSRLLPGALDVLEHLGRWGPTAILTDGEAVYQPWKVRHAGLWDAVEGRVLIYTHKEQMLDDLERRLPADSYVMVDDKLWILAAMKQVWGNRLTTVWAEQGHYSRDAARVAACRPADIRVERIAALTETELARFAGRPIAGASC